MNDDRHLIIRFHNETKMEMSFTIQIRYSKVALMEASKQISKGDRQILQTGRQLIIVPSAIPKFDDVSAAPTRALSFGVINGVRFVGTAKST
jgi:hypothetical protein